MWGPNGIHCTTGTVTPRRTYAAATGGEEPAEEVSCRHAGPGAPIHTLATSAAPPMAVSSEESATSFAVPTAVAGRTGALANFLRASCSFLRASSPNRTFASRLLCVGQPGAAPLFCCRPTADRLGAWPAAAVALLKTVCGAFPPQPLHLTLHAQLWSSPQLQHHGGFLGPGSTSRLRPSLFPVERPLPRCCCGGAMLLWWPSSRLRAPAIRRMTRASARRLRSRRWRAGSEEWFVMEEIVEATDRTGPRTWDQARRLTPQSLTIILTILNNS